MDGDGRRGSMGRRRGSPAIRPTMPGPRRDGSETSVSAAGTATAVYCDWRSSWPACWPWWNSAVRVSADECPGPARRTGWPRGTRRRRSPWSRPWSGPSGSTVISMVFKRHLRRWMVSLIEPSARDCSTTGWPRLRASMPCLLDGVRLEQPVELLWLAPAPVVVVEADRAGGGVADDGVEPAGQPDEQAGGLALEERGGAVDGLGQAEPAAGGGDRRRGRGPRSRPGDDVAHFGPPHFACRWGSRRDGAATCVEVDADALPGVGAGPGVRRLGSPPDARLFGTDI